MATHNVPRDSIPTTRTEKQKQEELHEIHIYKDLEDLINAKILERQYTAEVLNLTSQLLKKNPEYSTIWNIRRRVLTRGLFSSSSPLPLSAEEDLQTGSPCKTLDNSSSEQPGSTSISQDSTISSTSLLKPETKNTGSSGITIDLNLIKADLEFLFPLMVKFPKCYWLWNYRVWLLEEANKRLDASIARELWSRELVLVSKMLVKDSRNFHGWGYRRRVVDELESTKLSGRSMVEAEFEYTTRMIHGDKGLSNFSAFHRRSKLIPRLLDERRSSAEQRKEFLDSELDLIISAMYTDSFPYAQSAWFYYQFLMTTLTNPSGYQLITPAFNDHHRISYVTKQLQELNDLLDGAEDCKWTYSALIEYTLALARLERRDIACAERENCCKWLQELKTLDSAREGRWTDLAKIIDM